MLRLTFLWLVVAAAVALVAATAYKLTRADDGGPGGPGGFAQATPVEVHVVEPVAFADLVEALGTARANESVSITSKVTDVIGALEFDSGDTVHAGDILATLADAEEAASLNEARATYQEALRERDRTEDLATRGVAARQSLDELNSNVDRAKARMDSIEARLADRVVRAPFDGVIGLRDASPGMLVRPGDVIATLDDVSVIKLDFTVPELFLGAIHEGETIEAQAAAYPDAVFEGQVSQIDSRVDPVTRSATVRALIDNADGRILPGMLMVVEVVRNERQSLAVPELAIVRRGDEAFVYVVETGEGGAVARSRTVQTGARKDGLVEITAGLEAGERVVAAGTHRINEGSRVVVPADAAPGPQTPVGGSGA
jgi:membrane fusion protein (multidrug efflux system)